MFLFVNSKLKKFYDVVAKSYVSLLVDHPTKLILFYFILSVILSFGLFQIRVNLDTDSLTFVRNSESMNNAKILNKTFPFDQHKRHFINKLLDLGHYVEIIVTVKANNKTYRDTNDDLLKPEFNMINTTILKEFNYLFDSILNLSINDTIEVSEFDSALNQTIVKNVSKSYSYSKDLCARRLNKCSIEGGLVRQDFFQKNLLNHIVDYQIKDPKSSYGDADYMDGFSFNVLFGKYRLEKLIDNSSNSYYGDKYAIYHASTFRVRFDLLSTNPKEKDLAIKYMHKFADYMGELEAKEEVKHLNFSYYTSHTLRVELEKYSKIDSDLLKWSFICFWTVLILTMCFNLNTSWSQSTSGKMSEKRHYLLILKNYFCCFQNGFHSFFINHESFCIRGGSYLPLILLVKFVLTITSSFGAVSLINVEVNPLTATTIIVFMSN